MSNFEKESENVFNRKCIPLQNENLFSDILEINELTSCIKYVYEIKDIHIHYRAPENCPIYVGNWICKIKFCEKHAQDIVLEIKLPKEMSNEKMLKYFEPLLNNPDLKNR